MANKNNTPKNGASNETAQVDVKDLIARLNALTVQVEAVASGKTTPAPAKRGRKASVKAEPKPETWDTVGKAAETIEDAVAFQHRVSVQVQKSSKGRTQVHIYSQVCVPADRIRANTKGLEKQKVENSEGKTVEGFWLNQKNPLIIRGDQKESVKFLTTLIENAH